MAIQKMVEKTAVKTVATYRDDAGWGVQLAELMRRNGKVLYRWTYIQRRDDEQLLDVMTFGRGIDEKIARQLRNRLIVEASIEDALREVFG